MGAAKVTMTLPDELLTAVDRFVATHPGATRSGVCSVALREWLRLEQEAEIERYYGSLTDEERAEDAWTSLAVQSAGRFWP